ncbi:lipopolysaccharide biosynthesis protein [Clostridium felsineum]|uniref:Polysaccharide biosynthesis protein n=1 Tax=Clostridium felsineum TaxID=36839 RepID=A0A1S8LWH6_9CLOT|nr:oligosaccharide flippase family protein [Clostridium felsineum]URZ08139.1 hypothetical protein CLROS_035050 [Clostridium felsineum]URZ13170.1 hypothetical protein CROST_039200 [Clostridium felsineum]
MNRAKLFIENFLVYGLGSVISKIVPLIMLPIVTRLMPNTFYYGLNDISNIVVSFGSAIALVGMYDAMFRMFFDKEDIDYKKQVCSTAFYFVTITSIVVFIVLIFFGGFFSKVFFSSYRYTNLLMISALSILIGSTNSIISAPTRMQNKRKIFLITNTLTPIISYCISVPLLLKGMYVMALPFASLLSSLSMLIIFYILNSSWFSIKKANIKVLKQLIKIGLPLMPNFLIYWIFNSCDRMMIAKIMGNSYVGIYGVGARVSSISQFIYTAFAGGWQYFAFSTMKNDDQVQLTSNIFEYLGIISYSATLVLTVFSDHIFKMFFKGEYINGAIIFPYMFLAPLLLMLYQTICNQFLVKKKTWPSALILSCGAIINILANYFLIPLIGIEGAAIGTFLGYAISVLICSIVLTKMKLVSISTRFIVDSFIMVIFFILWRNIAREKIIVSIILALITFGIFVTTYMKDIRLLKRKFLVKSIQN